MTSPPGERRPKLTLALVIGCTVLGLAGTDLVLPAVPTLPDTLGGSVATAQLVLATFVAGAGLGLILFGELGARFDQRRLLLASLAAYAVFSALAALAETLSQLIAIRFVQGLASAAAAVFAPGIIRVLFDEAAALRAIGILGSIESLVPALAPIAGVQLLAWFGWQASFIVIAAAAGLLWLGIFLLRHRIPDVRPTRSAHGYASLLGNPVYLRYALSQALTLGGLLVLVFGAPAVITRTMAGTLDDFIVMQIAGITFFIAGASSAGRLSQRFGGERMISVGSSVSCAGACLIAGYAAFGGNDPAWLAGLFVPMNFGLGLRGPPGFYAAIVAADGDDARASALLILLVLLITAAGTVLAAPLLLTGLLPLAAIAALISAASLLCLALLPRRPSSRPDRLARP